MQESYDREVPSAVVGTLVMEELRRLDPVAYLRFASVYREFRDIRQFLEELRPMVAEADASAPGAPVGADEPGEEG